MTGSRAPAPCPHCAIPMREVSARARSGYLLLLDQCPRCGGVWCDRWELFPLAAEEAARIDPVDGACLASPTPTPQAPGRCPRCTATLQLFRDPLLPPDARIERCRVCDGMWMNRGELVRAKRRSPPSRGAAAGALAALTDSYGAASNWSKVANLDAATYAVDDEERDDNVDLRTLLWSAAPWIVLRTLLRLLLGI